MFLPCFYHFFTVFFCDFSAQSFAPSHVLSVLASRPEPKILKINQTNVEKLSGSVLHSMHLAGGYQHINYTRRNWGDIIEDITAHAKNMSVNNNISNSGNSGNSGNSSNSGNTSNSGNISNDGSSGSSSGNGSSNVSDSVTTQEQGGSSITVIAETVWPWPSLWE